MTTWTQPRAARSRGARPAHQSVHQDAAFQVALIGAAILLYFGVRGATEGSELDAVAHGVDLLRFEQALGLDVEATVQQWALRHDWLITTMNWVYIWGHWPAIIGTLLWLHRTHGSGYLRLRNAMFLSGAVGLIVFLLYPVAPPRLLGDAVLDAGLLLESPVDTVTQRSSAYRVLQPPSLVNKYAALPSFHVGWNLLVGLAVASTTRSRPVRLLAAVSPAAMAAAVVITANHYVVDVAAGALIAGAAWLLAGWIARRRPPQSAAY